MRTIPETAATKDWPRRVAQANADLQRRVAALETNTVTTMTFTPSATPGSPVEGMTYMDSSTHKLRVYDGTTWQDCW